MLYRIVDGFVKIPFLRKQRLINSIYYDRQNDHFGTFCELSNVVSINVWIDSRESGTNRGLGFYITAFVRFHTSVIMPGNNWQIDF